MSLEGLRAWIGLVERKLKMRTRVFLVLVAIAVGGAAAGIYLALEAQDEAVTKSDLQAVRDELAGGAPATGGGDLTQLEAEVEALRSELSALRAEGVAPAGKGGGAEAPSGSGENGAGKAGGVGTPPANRKQLKEEGEEAIEKAGK